MKSKTPKDMIAGTIHSTKLCGDLEIVNYFRSKDVTIRFLSTGHIKKTRSDAIRNGQVSDPMVRTFNNIGYVGDGPYSGGVHKDAMVRWSSMLQRCYSDLYQSRQPTYKGCTVCDEWHNFQNFAKWYYENYPADGGQYHLDKDIKIKGNKIYSHEACSFVTPKENVINEHAKLYKITSPDGLQFVIGNLAEFCHLNNIPQSTMAACCRGSAISHQGWSARYHIPDSVLDQEWLKLE